MAVQAALRGFVVIRRHQQTGIGARAGRSPGQFDRFARGIGAGAGNNGAAARQAPHAAVYDVDMLAHIQRSALTGGANGHHGRRAGGAVPIEQAVERGPVDAAIGAHRGDQGDNTACNPWVSPFFIHNS